MSHTEEELRAAGFKPPETWQTSEEQERTKRELDARMRGLSRELAEASKDITVTVMTKEKLREFLREEVRKALAEE